MELINPQQTALIAKEQVQRYGHEIWVIGPYGSDADLARMTGVNQENFHWLANPKDLLGHDEPIVIIMPNWWRHDYSGMEDILTQVNARIFNVYFGRKPNWKTPPEPLYDRPALPDESLSPDRRLGEGEEQKQMDAASEALSSDRARVTSSRPGKLQIVLRKFSTFWDQTFKRPWT